MFLLKLLREHRKVIISCRNSGFGDNLLAAANAWYYAKNTGRALVIYWYHSRYLADKSENAFSHFFEIPASIEGVPIITASRIDRLSGFLLLHLHYLLPRPDPLMYFYRTTSKLGIRSDYRLTRRIRKRFDETDERLRAMADLNQRVIVTHGCFVPNEKLRPFFDALSLNEAYRTRADAFADAHFREKKVIGVHIRYYNQNMLPSDHTKYWLDQVNALSVCLDKIQKAAAGLEEQEYVVFLCTDSRLVHDFISGSIGNVVAYEKEFGRDSSKEMHEELPEETAAATVIEMFLLAKSDVLVRFPPGSWFSHYASLYAKNIIT
ncbi:MAG: nodulation protein NodZ [Thermodesulfobacteriota bacterium]